MVNSNFSLKEYIIWLLRHYLKHEPLWSEILSLLFLDLDSPGFTGVTIYPIVWSHLFGSTTINEPKSHACWGQLCDFELSMLLLINSSESILFCTATEINSSIKFHSCYYMVVWYPEPLFQHKENKWCIFGVWLFC